MNVKYYFGMNEVPRDEYEAKKAEEMEAGHGIAATEEVDGYPEYVLDDGTVIRGDKEGGFNRIEDGEVMEPWIPGTENEWVQGEPTDSGEADFFFKA